MSVLELMFAMVIFMIVSMLLAGMARKIYKMSLSAKSATNLRALAEANLLYAADHNGVFCPALEPRNLIRWHGGRTSVSAKFDPTKGYLYPYLQDGGRSLHCPVFEGFYTQSKDTFEDGAGDYGYNEMYIGGTPKDQYKPERVANVTNPTRTIMFTDTCLPRSEGIQEYPFSEPYYAVNPNESLGGAMCPSVQFRHDGFAHVAWCDGSVTAERPALLGEPNIYGGDNQKYQTGWLGPDVNNGWWNSRQTPSP
jgi:prepilin-type processing-associated H-X9-DG protein